MEDSLDAAPDVAPDTTPVVPQDTPEPRPEPVTPDPAAAPAAGSEPEKAAAERDDKGRFKSAEARIAELTRARRAAEREAEYWRGVATPAAAEPGDEKPTVEKFDDYSKYVEALTDWKAARAVESRMADDSGRRAQEAAAAAFQARQEAARQALPDYESVVGAADAHVEPHVRDVLLDSEQGPHLVYHFAKNPAALDSLNRMSPLQAARAIGALEAQLAAAPARKTTNTPAPASTAAAAGRATTPALANASMADYMAQRKAQGARWAR